MGFIPEDFASATCVINATGDPEPMVTTLAFSFLGTTEPGLAAWDGAADAISDFVRARMVSTYSVARVDFTYRSDGDLKLASSTSGAGAGLVTGSALPQNCAVLVRKRGLVLGRKNRGRMYLPGLRESEVSDLGVITASELTALQTAANTLWNYFDTVTPWTGLCILHDDEGLSQPAQVGALEVDNVIATQRRRLRR